MRALPAHVLVAVLGALAACAASCGQRAEVHRPNVLLISIDTLRADHVGCYGYARATTPHIDALAAEGALYERCWSSTSWTLPAHLSMLTGEFVSAHGICDDRLWQVVGKPNGPERLPLCGTFLPEVLQRAGYRTAGFYSWKYLEPRFGFGPGFDVYERRGDSVYSDPVLSKRFEELRTRGDKAELDAWRAREPKLFDDQRPTAGETVDAAIEWLDRAPGAQQGDAPFFLFVHLFDVHDAYKPPPPYDKAFTDPAYAGPIDGDQVSSPKSLVTADMKREDLQQLIALYDGEIAWTDSQVGRLLEYLKTRGLSEDTLVILTGDHGEEFFEHGQKTHRNQLQPESLRVPLIWRWPGHVRAGTRIAANAGLVDILPTVCEQLDLPLPSGVSGASLAAELASGKPGAPREYLSELLLFEKGWVPKRDLSLVRGDEQVLMHTLPGQPPRMLRHDLAADPEGRGAGEPIAAASADAQAIEARIALWRERLRGLRCPPAERRGDSRPLSEAEQRELSNVGYAQSSGEARAGGSSERLCLDGCVWPER